MKDSPTGKRYGHRDRQGRIIEAYGFDLSPLAVRYAEFVRLAEEAKAERAAVAQLSRRKTIARRAIAQITETALEQGLDVGAWVPLRDAVREKVRGLQAASVEELAMGVAGLERMQAEAASLLEKSSYTAPLGAENSTHNIPTDSDLYPNRDTVGASANEAVMAPQGVRADRSEGQTQAQEVQQAGAGQREEAGSVIKVSIDEVVRMAPRLRSYLSSSRPTWADIINAADRLRADLDISRSLWGEACAAMGRNQAAVAIGIVSAKRDGKLRSPGGYFHGVVQKAKAGELHLDRTIWGMRQERQRQHRAAG
jgi:replication initiation protein RepC